MFVFLCGFSMLFNFVFKKKNLFERHWWVFYGRFLSERLSYAVWSLVHCIHGTLLSCVCFNVFNTNKKETSGFLLRDFIVHAYESEITLTSSGWIARQDLGIGCQSSSYIKKLIFARPKFIRWFVASGADWWHCMDSYKLGLNLFIFHLCKFYVFTYRHFLIFGQFLHPPSSDVPRL